MYMAIEITTHNQASMYCTMYFKIDKTVSIQDYLNRESKLGQLSFLYTSKFLIQVIVFRLKGHFIFIVVLTH